MHIKSQIRRTNIYWDLEQYKLMFQNGRSHNTAFVARVEPLTWHQKWMNEWMNNKQMKGRRMNHFCQPL